MKPMNCEGIEVVLLDLGGVLVELTGVPTMLRWVGGRTDVDELWHRWLTSPAVRAFETGKLEPQEFADLLIEEMALPVGRSEFLDAFTLWPRGLFDGALELLNDIRRPVVRAMLSNTNGLHWPRLMDEMGLSEVFEHHFASHLTGNIKPDAQAFEHVVDSLGCKPHAVLFVDDNQLNVAAAESFGMKAFRVQGVAQAREIIDGHGLLNRPREREVWNAS